MTSKTPGNEPTPAKWAKPGVRLSAGYKPRPRKTKREYKKSEVVSVKLGPRQLYIYDQLENKSAFFKIALDNAVGVMTWDTLKKRLPDEYYDTERFEDVVDEYNDNNPSTVPKELEAYRKGKSEGTKRTDAPDNKGSDTELW